MSSETGKDKQRAHGTLEGTNHAVHTVPRQKTLSTDYTVPYGPACQVISDKHRQVLSTNALMILMVPNNASSSTQVMVFKWMPPCDGMQSSRIMETHAAWLPKPH